MTGPSRTSQVAHIHKILKKHYKPVVPDSERPVLEHLLFACCLEGARYDVAEGAFGALVEEFFDWNEIRVSSVRELSEVLHTLPDARTAAFRIKSILQHVFEASYSFDLESLRKTNLGPAVERLKKTEGATEFAIRYVVQSALGGHAVPIDAGALRVLRLLDVITEQDVEAGAVPGLERAIAKNKGVEFGSLVHQLGAEFLDNPYSAAIQATLLELNPAVKPRLPKRPPRRRPAVAADGAAAQAPEAKAVEPPKPGAKRGAEKVGKKAAVASKASPARKPGDQEREKGKKPPAQGAEKPSGKKASGAAKKRLPGPAGAKAGFARGAASSKLSKRKPR